MPSPDSTNIINSNVVQRANFNKGLRALEAYNDRNSLGATLARLIISRIPSTEDSQDRVTEAELVDKAMRLEPELEELGLKFDFNEQKGATIFHEEGTLKPKDLRLEITDAGKLTDFLRQLEVSDLEEDDQLKKNLQNMIRILSQQMVQYYESCDSRGTTVVDNANALLGEFRRIGLDETAESIETYWIHSTRRTLREFMVLSDTQCFHKAGGGGFDASVWHLDTTTDRYAYSWERTAQAIQASLQNPRAISMVMKSLDNLINSAEVAIADMERILKEAGEEANEYTLQHAERIETARQYKEQYEDMKARLATSTASNSTAN